MSEIPDRLRPYYERLAQTRETLEKIKWNQENRGIENYKKRSEHRAATHKTWRQMKGVQFALHELNRRGNRPYVQGMV